MPSGRIGELLPEAPARLRSAGIVPLDFGGAPTEESLYFRYRGNLLELLSMPVPRSYDQVLASQSIAPARPCLGMNITKILTRSSAWRMPESERGVVSWSGWNSNPPSGWYSGFSQFRGFQFVTTPAQAPHRNLVAASPQLRPREWCRHCPERSRSRGTRSKAGPGAAEPFVRLPPCVSRICTELQ